jgi:photosystem II stability/assembly factor-like uncharacterized protein
MSYKKTLTLFYALLGWAAAQAQADWTITSLPRSGRYDDVYFINDTVGWVAGGDRRIQHTTDGGRTWKLQFAAPGYLRSIEFATPQLGFCGSLDSALFRTTDGGQTWTNVTTNITPKKPAGICGLAAPDPLNIYGCGIWHGPAFIVKSTDGGLNWTYIDMSAYATRLVDIFFLDKDTGFVTGSAYPASDGGVILYTTDGGMNWQAKFKTMLADDIVWKIQTPDSLHFFGSIQSLPGRPARVLQSTNKGLNWSSIIFRNDYQNLEMIGFIDKNVGWTGGRQALFKTIDGGQTWSDNLVSGDVGYNRFFRVNKQVVYLTGYSVYKLKSSATPPPVDPPANHSLQVLPNPVKGSGRIILGLAMSTYASLSLYTTDGKKVIDLLDGYASEGVQTIPLNLNAYARGTYYLVLRTNEGIMHATVVKH